MKILLVLLSLSLVILSSCAPVRFTRSNTLKVSPGVNIGGVTNTVACDPQYDNGSQSFTYSQVNSGPSIISNCDTSPLNYEWTVVRANGTAVNSSIPTLTGQNPAQVDIRSLGEGVYYVTLVATDPSGNKLPYTQETPLELIVPGPSVTNNLNCDPKLNASFTSISVEANDNNPTVKANCSPQAEGYIWSVTKNGVSINLPGLVGEQSMPDIKSFGVGTYQISLYATLTGSSHWESSSPLTIMVNSANQSDNVISCNPRINGSLTSLNLTSTSAHPLISANCDPTDVVYQWTVYKNGQLISLPSLNGAQSNPTFLQQGDGTYLVYLTATKNNFTTFSPVQPLTITVQGSNNNATTIQCSPRLNTDSVAITINAQSPQTTLSANCNPANVQYTWTVFRNEMPVTIAGLSGSSSTPNFMAAGLGTYTVYLVASQNGFNSYVIPTPLQVTVANVVSDLRQVSFTKTVQATDNKVDILLVVDDSNSMLPDNRKLAQKLQGFVTGLSSSQIDWKMCATVTRAQKIGTTFYWGASRNWVNYVGSPRWILNSGATDPYSIFTSTIEAIGAGWADSDDERGIKAAFWHAEYAASNQCYRDDASLAVIIISDEDVRSVGGDASRVHYGYELFPLEAEDLPQNYVNKVKQKFGMDKRLSVNSIIVRPGDTTCMAQQDAGGAKSQYGYKYHELSQLTNGFSSSICENDYSQNLNYFKDRIVSSLSSIPLECSPVGSVNVTFVPSLTDVSTTIQNNSLVFNPAVPVGYQINLKYNCASN